MTFGVIQLEQKILRLVCNMIRHPGLLSFFSSKDYLQTIIVYLFPIGRSHGTDMVHQLLVLHEAPAAEVTCAGAPCHPGGGGGGRAVA